MGFAEAVKAVREQRRLSKAELAERSGLAASYLSRLEAGDYRSPSIETLTAVAEGLEMDPRDLLVLGGYVPEEESSAGLALAQDEISRTAQDAIRRIAEIAQAATEETKGGGNREEEGAGFDAESLAERLAARRELVGITVNQAARRARVPLRQILELEDGSMQREPSDLSRVLREGYGLSEREAELLIVEMALHLVLRRHPAINDEQRRVIVDVAVATMGRN